MNTLVTGATGFLGSWAVRRLLQDGHNVSILRRQNSDLSELPRNDIQHFIGDITDPISLNEAVKGQDAVFHLAGLIAYSTRQRAAMEKINIGGTKNVIAACETHSIPRLIYMSSVVAVGASFDGKTPLNEDSQYNVGHLNMGYFETKRLAEIQVLKACQEGRIDAVILNPSTVYGAGDARKSSRKTQVKVASGRMPFYTHGGVNVVHVRDVIDATIKAWKKGVSGQRYILAGENITIQRLFTEIASAAGVQPPRLPMPNLLLHTLGRLGDWAERHGKKPILTSENAWTATLYHWFDSTKAQRELGLKITPAATSIKESVLWMKEHLL